MDLAGTYPMRWECETVIGHHKTDMGAGKAVLRSKDPEGVAQEMWALFAVYQAIQTLIGAAVDATGIPPDKISFPHALAAATDSVVAGFSPQDLDLALATFLLKILDPGFFVRDRPDRASPRATREGRRLPRPQGPPRRRPRHPPTTDPLPAPQQRVDHLKQGHWARCQSSGMAGLW